MCAACGGTGYVIWIYPASKPRSAHWFTRGPNGERAIECDCQRQPKEPKSPSQING